MTPTRTNSPVLVIGTGLLGTSVGLGLRRLGVDVMLSDASPSALQLSIDYGAGRRAPHRTAGESTPGDTPDLVVVCVPPDVVAEVVARALQSWPDAIVTDVASIKAHPLEQLTASGADLRRYVGSHPMAGRETGGPLSGRADLFVGRPWVIAAHDDTSVRALQWVEGLALDLGGTPLTMPAEEHDEAVALISHVPQLVSSLLAARLVDDELGATALAGQGIKDVTRIASSDPTLWVQILSANGPRIARILRRYAIDLDDLATALEAPDDPGARRTIAEHMLAGNAGVAALPGKHGKRRAFAGVTVMIDDRPGQLARLMTDVGDAQINIEDFRIEHSQGMEVGLVEILVIPEARQRLVDELTARDWRIAQ